MLFYYRYQALARNIEFLEKKGQAHFFYSILTGYLIDMHRITEKVIEKLVKFAGKCPLDLRL